MTGTLTLIGSGEFQPGMVATHRAVLARLNKPKPVFLDTPAGFQTNADELWQAARSFFKQELGLELDRASLRHSNIPAAQIEQAKAALAAANIVVAGPGSPTYAIRHWNHSSFSAALAQAFNAGAHLVFASSAVIALGRRALPVYEIYKVGEDPFWADGLDLLGPHGFNLALVPHWNNRDERCFVGRARFEQLAAQLSDTVILGIDENTAVSLDLATRTAAVSGAGTVTIQFQGHTHSAGSGTTFGLGFLTADGARASGIDSVRARPAVSPPAPVPPPAAVPQPAGVYVPPLILEWNKERNELRAAKDYKGADVLRERIASAGYNVKDSPQGPQFTRQMYASSAAVPSQLDQPASVEWSVTLLAHNNSAEIIRAARSALKHSAGHPLEVVIVDDVSDDGTAEALADFACEDERVRLAYLSQPLGEGAGRNTSLRAARGHYVLILGGHMEIEGDVFAPLTAALADDAVGAAGSNPLVTADLFTFNPAPTSEADALELYIFAFRRERLKQVGWLDEKFVFYRNLDLDWSLAFKDKGLHLRGVPNLPLTVHEHPYLRLDPVERDTLSKKNYRRFLDKWKGRTDLLVQSEVRSPRSEVG